MYKPLDIYLPFIIIMTCWIALVVKAYIFSLQMWMLVIQEIQITERICGCVKFIRWQEKMICHTLAMKFNLGHGVETKS